MICGSLVQWVQSNEKWEIIELLVNCIQQVLLRNQLRRWVAPWRKGRWQANPMVVGLILHDPHLHQVMVALPVVGLLLTTVTGHNRQVLPRKLVSIRSGNQSQQAVICLRGLEQQVHLTFLLLQLDPVRSQGPHQLFLTQKIQLLSCRRSWRSCIFHSINMLFFQITSMSLNLKEPS
uniref:Uncharacterized protein MANES_12G064000 n=1 Tax=Rhizophora mucronata TaxID=61149 RepID=A0A2P2LZ17_RHIMU